MRISELNEELKHIPYSSLIGREEEIIAAEADSEEEIWLKNDYIQEIGLAKAERNAYKEYEEDWIEEDDYYLPF